jgi:hypothetical protein
LVSRFLWLTTGVFLALRCSACAQVNEVPFSKIEASVELQGEAPYVGEPLRLVVRSAIHAQVANERMIQPDLTDFDWQQFGVDSMSQEFIDGFWMPVMSRVLMIYPLRPGRLTIDPFKRHITYFGSNGERMETEILSRPVTIEVRSHDALAGPDAYWIPARDLRITDEWTPESDNIPLEETAQRTITIEADGLTADRLPNLPSFRAPGIITFAGPIQRQTIITDHGPLGRAIFRWRIRPASQAVATAPSVKVHWFDVSKRQMREAFIPERRVAFRASGHIRKSGEETKLSEFLTTRSLVAFILSFAMTAATGFLFVSMRFNDMAFWRSLFGSLRLFAILVISGWRDDKFTFYATLHELRKTDPLTWRTIENGEMYSALIQDLQSMIYAGRLAKNSMSLWKRALAIFKIYLTIRLRQQSLESTER